MNNSLPSFHKRKIDFDFLENTKKVYTIVWPRRAGKTYFCYQIIDWLLQSWIPKSNILYFYLENDELFPMSNEDLNVILDTFFEIANYQSSQKYFIFLDEIQEIPYFEKFVAKVLSQYPNIEIVLTWSSASMLSREISTTLRWKAINIEVLPLMLEESLQFRDIHHSQYMNTQELIQYKNSFSEFLNYGSFPEIVLENNTKNKDRIIKDYFDLVFYKDIVDRNNLKSIKKLKTFRKIITSYMAQICSYNKLSLEVGVEYNTVTNWMNYFLDAYYAFEVKNFSFSVGKVEWSISKIYLIDNCFYHINFLNYKQDYGILFENFVFLELRKMWFVENESIFYLKDDHFDIDFIVWSHNQAYPIQVCYELNDKNIKREVLEFEKFINKNKLWKWYLITRENNTKINSDSVMIMTPNIIKEIFM